MIKALIFDLDNTLYDEREYLDSALCEVARIFAGAFGVPEERLARAFQDTLNAKGSLYPRLYNDALESLGCRVTDNHIREMVEVFHRCSPSLKLYQDAEQFLNSVKGRLKLGIVTNGRPTTQKLKVEMLGLNKWMDSVIYASGYEAEKPDPSPYLAAARELGIAPWEATYVGDNPTVDFPGAKAAGMLTIRVLRGEFANVTPSNPGEQPDWTVSKYDELALTHSFFNDSRAPRVGPTATGQPLKSGG